jgi:hypothetical protein
MGTSQTSLVPEIVDDHGDQADMAPDVLAAYAVYAGDANRSLRRTATMLNIPAGTIRTWAFRYRWARRVRVEDAEVGQGAMDRALTFAASLRMAALNTLMDSLTATIETEFGPVPDHKARNDAAKAILDRSGMRPHLAMSIIDRTQLADESDAESDDRLSDDASTDDVLDELIRLRRAQS